MAEISLQHHGLIEAHAGTGKTYTIVQLVLRILQSTRESRFVHIRELLLVTYTEKAAGELKKRIRAGIEEQIAIQQDPALLFHLSDCRNNLHEAYIGTIHGVCLRLLQTWPFETGIPFESEMADDREGLSQALRECIRSDWQDPASCFPWALDLLRQNSGSWKPSQLGRIVDLAGALLDTQHTVLDRRAVQGMDLMALHAAWESLSQELAAPACQAFPILVSQYCDALVQLAHADTYPAHRKDQVLAKAEELRALPWTAMTPERIKSVGKIGQLSILTAALRKIPEAALVESLQTTLQAQECVTLLVRQQELRNLVFPILVHDTALRIRDRWLARKKHQGLMSFQDILAFMEKASRLPQFRKELQSRLAAAIIDEFQDTSILQWSIFRNLFLEDSGHAAPRLYLVGDPKQSIYSFQGADVATYREARKALLSQGGRLYGLVSNYRSAPELVAGYNTILGAQSAGSDWFATEGIAYPSEGESGALANTPLRTPPPHPLSIPAVQAILLAGKVRSQRQQLARHAVHIVRTLVGTQVSIPKGNAWEERVLGYGDFAVVVETRSGVSTFLDTFQQAGIPAAQYKMEGVFQSPMARDWIALLRSLADTTANPSLRMAALLTRFYNQHPAAIDPEAVLSPSSGPSLDWSLWRDLADARRWGQLFCSILQRSQIEARLLRLADGERHLADLRQIADYCVQKLVRDSFTLCQLAEHLQLLCEGSLSTAKDQNLHTLATGRDSVKVLTMHASKGLEFPVVFVSQGSSKRNHPGNLWSWIGEDHQLHACDAAQKDLEGLFPGTIPPPLVQSTQERRRLHYVALTRPQLLLFVPMLFKELSLNDQGTPDWESAIMDPKWGDHELTPRLLQLLQQGMLHRFDPDEWTLPRKESMAQALVAELPEALSLHPVPQGSGEPARRAILDLGLSRRATPQTSYSGISRGLEHARELGPAEEPLPEPPLPEAPALSSALPGGRGTGDALHLVLESLLPQDLSWINQNTETPVPFLDRLEQQLQESAVLSRLTTEAERQAAVEAAARMLRGALHDALDLSALGAQSPVRLAELDPTGRRAEQEFQIRSPQGWLHGYMDLVFRLPNPEARHPWRYFVLDWKSNRLPQYTRTSIAASMEECHYTLQAKLYSHALHQFLAGLLGEEYDPHANLGGAVYIYLRGYEHAEHVEPWLHSAAPEEDARYVTQVLSQVFPPPPEVRHG